MAIQFLRAYVVDRANIPQDAELPIKFIASTEGVKSDGMELRMEDWSLDRFLRHPVILYGHQYQGDILPIGTGVPSFEGRDLTMSVRFDSADPFAMRVRDKVLKGMMGASVGWEQVLQSGKPRNELLEMSIVPVPLDAAALPQRAQRAYADMARQLAQLAGDEPWSFWQDGDMDTRIGKVLSARNLADLRNAISLIQTVIERAETEGKTDEAGKKQDEDEERVVKLDGVTAEWAAALTRMGV